QTTCQLLTSSATADCADRRVGGVAENHRWGALQPVGATLEPGAVRPGKTRLKLPTGVQRQIRERERNCLLAEQLRKRESLVRKRQARGIRVGVAQHESSQAFRDYAAAVAHL